MLLDLTKRGDDDDGDDDYSSAITALLADLENLIGELDAVNAA